MKLKKNVIKSVHTVLFLINSKGNAINVLISAQVV